MRSRHMVHWTKEQAFQVDVSATCKKTIQIRAISASEMAGTWHWSLETYILRCFFAGTKRCMWLSMRTWRPARVWENHGWQRAAFRRWVGLPSEGLHAGQGEQIYLCTCTTSWIDREGAPLLLEQVGATEQCGGHLFGCSVAKFTHKFLFFGERSPHLASVKISKERKRSGGKRDWSGGNRLHEAVKQPLYARSGANRCQKKSLL